jgi:Fe-S cluster assembly protein SufD
MSLARAIETGDLGELPSRRDEDWRWSDLRGLIRQAPLRSGAMRAPARSEIPNLFGDIPARTLSIRNGEVSGLDAAGVLVLGSDQPVALLRVVSAACGTSHTAKVEIRVLEGVSAVLLESHAGEGDYIASYDLTISIAAGARLERILISEEDATAIVVVEADVSMAPGARFAQTILTSGAKRQRLETRVIHPGGGAIVRLDGVYLLAGKRHADITTVVTHSRRDGATDQLTKGFVSDQARGVFQGRIVVAPGADGTDARMGHHALVLSDRAEVDAKPELEIFADDVACAHGNTVGALDEEALFYARQRGIPDGLARAMLAQAFVGEVIDRIEHAGARAAAQAWTEAHSHV